MAANYKQKNKEGDNIGNDYVGGDKVNSLIGKIIGNHNVTNIHIASTEKIKISKEDEKKYSDFIPKDKLPEFKNLIERIEFLCELGDYEEAKEFIEEANRIYHNHPILLNLHGLCEYAVLDKVEVIKHPWYINKTIKLFEKAREVDDYLSDYYGWNKSISMHFYKILIEYIEAVKNDVSWYFQSNQHRSYYKAIAKHLLHLENCFKIHQDPFYLKVFVNHLSGYEGYPWFDIDFKGTVHDLGNGIFENGAKGELDKLVIKIKEIDLEYIPPEIKYGDYFAEPKNAPSMRSKWQRLRILVFMVVALTIVSLTLIWSFSHADIKSKILLFLLPIAIWGVSHPFNDELSILQRIAKSINEKV
jgi:tetratricopeptide (TPR) repeat protein